MKRICFITPPSPFLLDERVFPALGILKVAAVAREFGYVVEHLDLNGVPDYADVVALHASDTEADVFALTATTPQLPAALRIAGLIRTFRNDAVIVLGGPHATLVHAARRAGARRAPSAWAQLSAAFDTVVVGDGETGILEAIMSDWPALVDADSPKTGLFMDQSVLDSVPWPARDLVDLDSYHYEIDGHRVTPLISQLGCPFGCHFCAGRSSPMLRRARIRSTVEVLAEIRHLTSLGYSGFMFFDDELNVNPNLTELLTGMRALQEELGVAFRCRGFVKAELFNEEQARLMYEAGFRKIMCGFESGSPRILRNINKNATLEDNTRAMEISHKYGLGMKALMSLGHPGEDDQTARATLDWLLRVQPDDFDCTIITAYPGSPYYDRARFEKFARPTWVFEVNGDALYMEDIDHSEIEDFYKGSLDSYRSYVWTNALEPGDIVSLRDEIERTVRDQLGIPYYQARQGPTFEASMGQLPGAVYRRSE